MTLIVDLVLALIALHGLRHLLRRWWGSRLGPWVASVTCREALRPIAARQEQIRAVNEALIHTTADLADSLRSIVGDRLTPLTAQLLELGFTGAGRWSDPELIANLQPEDRLRMLAEARLRGEVVTVETGGDGPIATASAAVAAAERQPAELEPAYRTLHSLGGQLPMVVRLPLEARLAAAGGDAELAARVAEQAAAGHVLDLPPEPILTAWRRWTASWAGAWLPDETPNVTAWREAKPLSQRRWEAPPAPGTFEQRLETLASVLQAEGEVFGLPGALAGSIRGLPSLTETFVYSARPEPNDPDAGAHWEALLHAIDAATPAFRGSALEAYDELLRAASHQVLNIPCHLPDDVLRFQLHVARYVTNPEDRVTQFLRSAATTLRLAADPNPLYDDLLDILLHEPSAEFWHAFAPRAAPLIHTVPRQHPLKPALLAKYLASRWLRDPDPIPWSHRDTPRLRRAAPLQLAAILHDINAGAAPTDTALRGISETERAILDQALAALVDDLANRGRALLITRYRHRTTQLLRATTAPSPSPQIRGQYM